MSKKIEIEDLDDDMVISEDEIKHVKGGLLPAFQRKPVGTLSVFPKVEINIDKIAYKL